MNEDDKKAETEVTPEGAVEIQEEDLDEASGGAAYVKLPVDQLKLSPTANLQDSSLKQSKGYDLKGYDLKKF